MIYDCRKGHRGKVLVNGVEVKSPRCKTGIRGWAQVIVDESLKLRKLKGRVQFVRLKWSETE